MDAIEKRARELLASAYADTGAPELLVDEVRGGKHDTASDNAAIRAIISSLTPPEKPDPALLVSMAMRINHGFGLMDRMAQNSLLTDMSKVWEEIVGRGYYSPENASRYLRELASADARPEVKNVNN